MSDPWSTFRSVGRVIDFEAWRSNRKLVALPDPSARKVDTEPGSEARAQSGFERPIERLESAIARLDRMVVSGRFRIGPRAEAELLAIATSVMDGRVEQAAGRTERLTEWLGHPSRHLARRPFGSQILSTPSQFGLGVRPAPPSRVEGESRPDKAKGAANMRCLHLLGSPPALASGPRACLPRQGARGFLLPSGSP
jgi:hypothetical protein